MIRSDAPKAVVMNAVHAMNVLTLVGAVVAAQLIALPAHAQAAPGAGPSPIMQFVPIIVMFVVMYFLMIRPQNNKAKAHTSFVTGLKRGDEVVTASGILGRIEGLTEQFVTLEIAPNTRIKILRSQIATSVAAATNTTTKEVST